jgi:hypothetical protein
MAVTNMIIIDCPILSQARNLGVIGAILPSPHKHKDHILVTTNLVHTTLLHII